MKQDGTFSYFTTYKLTNSEIAECKYIETLQLYQEGSEWDSHDETHINRKDCYTDFREELINQYPKQRRILDNANNGMRSVSYKINELVIISIVATNHKSIKADCSLNDMCKDNPQQYSNFN